MENESKQNDVSSTSINVQNFDDEKDFKMYADMNFRKVDENEYNLYVNEHSETPRIEDEAIESLLIKKYYNIKKELSLDYVIEELKELLTDFQKGVKDGDDNEGHYEWHYFVKVCNDIDFLFKYFNYHFQRRQYLRWEYDLEKANNYLSLKEKNNE